MYVCCGVGCVRLSRCMWMRMVLDADGEARCCRLVERVWVDADGVGSGRRGALLSPGWLGLRGCGGVGVDGEAFLLLLG